MAFVHGSAAYLGVDNAATSLTDISAYTTSVEGFPGDAASHETTTFSKSTVTRSAGLKDTKVTVNGLYDATCDAVLAGIRGLVGTLTYRPAGAAGQQYSGEFLCTSYKVSTPVGGMQTWSASFEIASGDLADSTI
jgi:hypothetical protein